jgi:hypothetical protein
MPQTLLGLAQLSPQLQEALAADILEFYVLQMLPDPLVGVEIRSIAG